MRQEVTSAVDFIAGLLRSNDLTPVQIEQFRNTLNMLLCSHYEDHWFPEKPCKGSGYRCIRINHKMDPIVTRAAYTVGLSESELFDLLPSELTLWVDPDEVSYRIGEEGSIGVLFETDSASSSSESTSESSRTPSPVHQYQQPRSLTHSPHGSYHSGAPSPVQFMQTCKEQLRYYMPEMDNSSMHFPEYLSGFVAS